MQRKILLLLVGLLAIGSAAFAGSASAGHKGPRRRLHARQPARRERGARLQPRRRRHAPGRQLPDRRHGHRRRARLAGRDRPSATAHDLYAVNAGSNSITRSRSTAAASSGWRPCRRAADADQPDRAHTCLRPATGGARRTSPASTPGDGLAPIADSTRPMGAGAPAPRRSRSTRRPRARRDREGHELDRPYVDDACRTPRGLRFGRHAVRLRLRQARHLLTSNASGSASSYSV